MLSFWSKKPPVPATDGRQLHRGSRKSGNGVVYASTHHDRGVTFAFSGPASSCHSDEALKIAARVYSYQKVDEDEDMSETPMQRTLIGNGARIDNAQSGVIIHEPTRAKKLNKQEQQAMEASSGKRRHKLSAEGVRAVFSTAPSSGLQATPSSRHSPVPSRDHEVGTMGDSQVAANRHGVPLSATGFKDETDEQLSYGLQNGNRKFLHLRPRIRARPNK